MKKLDVGCGQNKREGFIGIDKNNYPGVDIIHDLDIFPYPFSDNEFEYIEMRNVLEHLNDPVRVFDEIYRIASNGATVHIITPHYSSYLAYGDFDHRYHFGCSAFITLSESNRFRIKKCRIHFTDLYKIIPISILANLFPRKWEKYLSFVFPALFLEVTLAVIKNNVQK